MNDRTFFAALIGAILVIAGAVAWLAGMPARSESAACEAQGGVLVPHALSGRVCVEPRRIRTAR